MVGFTPDMVEMNPDRNRSVRCLKVPIGHVYPPHAAEELRELVKRFHPAAFAPPEPLKASVWQKNDLCAAGSLLNKLLVDWRSDGAHCP